MPGRVSALAASLVALVLSLHGPARAEPWVRHTIDASSRGADGVRLGDCDGDGLPDIVTGWEQGGVVRICFHPGEGRVRSAWPGVTVGRAPDVEDAVFADLDSDGRPDVVSCCEGGAKTVFAHWAPGGGGAAPRAAAGWTTEPFPVTEEREAWMYALPAQIDGAGGIDLFVGSKGPDASVSWLQSPLDGDARDLSKWRLHRLYEAGWIMSLEGEDFDGDGDLDLLVSDRKGSGAGVLWLENPGAASAAQRGAWEEHRIGASGEEVMFLRRHDFDSDGLTDIACATREGHLTLFRRLPGGGVRFAERRIANPAGLRHGKSLAFGDLDLDGAADLATSCRPDAAGQSCVHWQAFRWPPAEPPPAPFDLGGPEGSKFDLIELIDLDGDGDLDLLTCEEAANLGVFWYENPARQ